jgi:acetylornithine deacetylase/succinyl-diaminopimelate desuccinylase-like protein
MPISKTLLGTSVCGLLAMLNGAYAQSGVDNAIPLLEQPSVRAAFESARIAEPETIDVQVRLCEIPAPPFGESARAAAYAELFSEAGLENVRIDKTGNVLAERPGRVEGPRLVISSHLDTVFPNGTDVRVTRTGDVLRGPGIGDDCRGLAVVLAVANALDAGGVETGGPITFVGTVGEEGLGDLRGVKTLFADTLAGRIDRFVSVDGGGMGITSMAVGSLRYRVTFSGPGGHSFGNFGVANPVHAVGRLVASVADFKVTVEPRTTFNVGRMSGGTSVNSIASEAWIEVDLRSIDQDALAKLDERFQEAVMNAFVEERARWNGDGKLEVSIELVGDRPSGETPSTSTVVETALTITRALGIVPHLDRGSTDANLPMSLGVPAITIGGGGLGTGAHSQGEAFDTRDSWLGTQRALLLAISLTE